MTSIGRALMITLRHSEPIPTRCSTIEHRWAYIDQRQITSQVDESTWENIMTRHAPDPVTRDVQLRDVIESDLPIFFEHQDFTDVEK